MRRIGLRRAATGRRHLVAGPTAIACAVVALASSPLLAAPSPVHAYGHRSFDSRAGLTSTSVQAMAQTPDGYLWIGTRSGLFRFDGQSFRRFSRLETPAILNDAIRVLEVGPDGTLWVGTAGGGLLTLRGPEFEQVPLGEVGSRAVVWDLVLDADGAWVATGEGLVRVVSGQGRRFEPLGATIVRSLTASPGHGLWIGTQERGLFRLEKGVLHEVDFPGPGTEVSGLASESGGALWLTVRNQLHRWDRPLVGRPDPIRGLGPISDLLEERDATWLTTTGGVVHFHDGEYEVYDAADGLSGDRATSLLRDLEGNLWVGTLHGLDQFIPGDVRTLTVRDGLPGGAVWAVLRTRNDELWVGADGGLGRREASGRFEIVDPVDRTGVWALAESHDGSLWIGTGGAGLIRRSGKAREVFHVADGLPGERVWTLLEDSRGRLWVGADESGLAVRENGRFVGVDTGLPAGARIWTLHEDDRGRIWVGTSRGLLALGEGAPRLYGDADGMPSQLIWSIHDEGGRLYLGTDDRGLARLDADGIRYASRRQGLAHDAVVSVFSDDRGGLWLTTPDGLLAGPRSSFDALIDGAAPAVPPRLFDRLDGLRSGLPSGGSPAAWRDRDGALWFATNEGLAHVDPNRLRTPPALAPPIVESLEVDGVAIPAGGSAAPGRRELVARYAALVFTHPERVRFRYRLEGHDDGWVEAGERRFASWSNLDPGEYSFRVAASDGGDWIEGRHAFRFALAPRLHETRIFLVGVGLALLAVALGGHHYRVRTLARREAARAERQERLHHSQRLQALGRFASGVAHDFNNLLLVISLETEALEQVPDLPAGIRDSLDRVRAAEEHAGALVRQLLEVARRRRSEPRTVDLARLVEDLTELLPRIAGRGVDLRRRFGARPVWVRLDPAQIEQIVINLVVNARDALPSRGGRIDVEVDVEALPIGGAPDEPRAVLSVRDDGEGISPAIADRIFDPFFTTKEPDRGTGLGLATVKSIVEECGGSISVESEPGRGACFRIRLPLATAPGEDAAPPP